MDLPGKISVLAMPLCVGLLLSLTALAQTEDEADIPYSSKGADSCLACHDDQVTLAVFRTRHAVPSDSNSPFGHGQLQCEACHGPGGNHAARVRRGAERPPVIRFGPDSVTPIAEQNNMCVGCHKDDTGFAWHGSGHDENTVACADCHTAHAERDPVLATATQPEVCFECHQQVRTDTLKPYAHPIRQGKMDCGGCHSPHSDSADQLLARQSINQTCHECHAEVRGPYLWEHAPVAEDCTTCHNPHGSNHPGMLARRAPLLCQGCHSQAGHPSVVQDERGLPANMPSQYLLGESCLNCHSQVHGSNHPSGSMLMR